MLRDSASTALICQKKPLHRGRLSDLPRARLQYLKSTNLQGNFAMESVCLPTLSCLSQTHSSWDSFNARLKTVSHKGKRRKQEVRHLGLIVSGPGSTTTSPKRHGQGDPVYLKGVFRRVWSSTHFRKRQVGSYLSSV